MRISQIIAQVNNSKLTGLPEVKADQGSLKNILAVAFGVAAALAVLTIVIAALNFATAGGDPEKISRSKSAIIYALVGLAIALLAEAIVLLILDKL